MVSISETKDKDLVDALKEARKFFEDTAKTNYTLIVAIASALILKPSIQTHFDAIPAFLFAGFFGMAAAIHTSHIGPKYRLSRLCQKSLTAETRAYIDCLGLDDTSLRHIAKSTRTSVYGVFAASSVAVVMGALTPTSLRTWYDQLIMTRLSQVTGLSIEWVWSLLAAASIGICWCVCFSLFNRFASLDDGIDATKAVTTVNS